MSRRRWSALAVAGLAVLAAGCRSAGGDGPTRTPPSSSAPAPSTAPSTSTPPTSDPSSSLAPSHTATTHPPTTPAAATVPADVPRTGINLHSATEKPPVMPVAATRHTEIGAEQFATFFVKTIDWGYATTSSAYMRHYFTLTCKQCKTFADGADNNHRAGLHYLGDRISIDATELVSSSGVNGSEQVADVSFSVQAASVVDSHGNVKSGGPPSPTERMRLYLKWGASRWLIVNGYFP